MIVGWWQILVRAAKSHRSDDDEKSSTFVKVADAVSAGMGTPLNIAVWAALVIGWTLLFIIWPNLQNTDFLPAWFTSNAYNFPLNSISTCAELFIGFLIAAAANRVEKRNYELHRHMAKILEHVEKLVEKTESEERQELLELRAIKSELMSWTRGV